MNLKQMADVTEAFLKEVDVLAEEVFKGDEEYISYTHDEQGISLLYDYETSCECCSWDTSIYRVSWEEAEDILEKATERRMNNIARNGNNGEHYMSRIDTLKDGYRHDMIDEVEEETEDV